MQYIVNTPHPPAPARLTYACTAYQVAPKLPYPVLLIQKLLLLLLLLQLRRTATKSHTKALTQGFARIMTSAAKSGPSLGSARRTQNSW
jgi:hypothetical protein